MRENEKIIRKLLSDEGIDTVGIIAFENARITQPGRLKYLPSGTKSIVCFAVPYYSGYSGRSNISLYAFAKDYHYYIDELGKRLIPKLKEHFENDTFYLTADKSPIDERDAAIKAGLGILGKNSLLITEKYSSFVFLAEIFTTLELDTVLYDYRYCEECESCIKACPGRKNPDGELNCLSFITQKKGTLTLGEAKLIKDSGCVWGCDICSLVCSHSKNMKKSPISFFSSDIIPYLTVDILSEMTEEEFSERAYAWRGRSVIERNIRIIEENGESYEK